MKVSEMIRKIKKVGCYIVEHGKEHDKWYSPSPADFSAFRDIKIRSFRQVQLGA